MRINGLWLQYIQQKAENLTHNIDIKRTGTNKYTLHNIVYVKHKNKQY